MGCVASNAGKVGEAVWVYTQVVRGSRILYHSHLMSAPSMADALHVLVSVASVPTLLPRYCVAPMWCTNAHKHPLLRLVNCALPPPSSAAAASASGLLVYGQERYSLCKPTCETALHWHTTTPATSIHPKAAYHSDTTALTHKEHKRWHDYVNTAFSLQPPQPHLHHWN